MVLEKRSGKFKITDIKLHHRITIIGRTGAGKSVLFDTMLNKFSKKSLVILLDTKREYHHIPAFDIDNEKIEKGLFRIYEIKYQGKIISDPKILAEFLSLIIFERNNQSKKKIPIILAIEELGNVVKKRGRLYDIMPNYAKIISQGRSQNIGFIGTTQRPQQIHTDLISQSQHLICFELTSAHDIDAVKTYFNPDDIRDLKKHQFFHLNYPMNYIKRCYRLSLTAEDKKFYNKIFGKP